MLLLACSAAAMAQETEEGETPPPDPKKSKFQAGFYVGSYWANKYSASTYNGYGFDADGNRNSFETSFMHQKIINEYGGGYGQTDLIAQALNVDPHQWSFNESDMPVNMHYRSGIMVGFNLRIPIDKTSAIIGNLNGSKLSLEGNFTITLLKPNNPNPALNNNIQTCTITGKEQRLLIQLGYQKLFGSDDKINFFAEAGFVGTLAKFDQNTVYVNNLQIDLTYYVNQTVNVAPPPTVKPTGFGIGAFASAGVHLNINPKFNLQLLYTLSHEKVNIGTNPTLKLQNGLGFRVYYIL